MTTPQPTDASQREPPPSDDPRDVLRAAPYVLRGLRVRLWTKREDLAKAQARLALHEADESADIAAALDDAGKPAYGNETARRAELARRLDADEDHRSLRRGVDEQRREIAHLDTDLEYEADLQRNARVLLAAEATR